MDPTLPLFVAVVLGCAAAACLMAMNRSRRDFSVQLKEAIARIAAGEAAVRLDPSGDIVHARLVSAFNQLAAEHDAGVTVDHREAAPFRRLRQLGFPAADDAVPTFVAVAEVTRFATLRRGIGFGLANSILLHLTETIRASLDRCEIGRVGRISIEFAFQARSLDEALQALHRLSEALNRRVAIDGYVFDLPIAIGFADSRSGTIREELVDQAAAALAAAQAAHQQVLFAGDLEDNETTLDDLHLMRDLPGAMARGELQLHYQPKLRSRTNGVDSVEALLRWFHPERGQVATDHLIELAENTGAIRDVTEWVIRQAVADQLGLAAQGHDLTIYVNISGVLLPDADFAALALQLVAHVPTRIGFEITETAVITDPDRALANLRLFTDAGIKIAIDDYGSGLSSLAYLKQLPAHELKIDRMFVSGLIDSHRDPLLVRSSIDLAHALEMEVTAEGVDSMMALSLLRVMGCDLVQGFLISPPLPVAALLLFLNDDAQASRFGSPAPLPPEQWRTAANKQP